MLSDIVLAIFIMMVGLCFAGMGTHIYQLVWRVPANIGYSGKTYLATLGHLSVSFFCGPYIMLSMSLNKEEGQRLSYWPVLLSSLVAFSWAFISGLFLVSSYIAIFS